MIKLDRDIVPLIPKVTTSKSKFVIHILNTCKKFKYAVDEKELYKGLHNVNLKKYGKYLFLGHYFCGLIFVKKLSFLIIYHELMHHIFLKLRFFSHNAFWEKFDSLLDKHQYSMARLKAKIECRILNLIQGKVHYYIME